MRRKLLRRWLALTLLLGCGGCQFLQNEFFYLDRTPPEPEPLADCGSR
jgi:hypothetical protein